MSGRAISYTVNRIFGRPEKRDSQPDQDRFQQSESAREIRTPAAENEATHGKVRHRTLAEAAREQHENTMPTVQSQNRMATSQMGSKLSGSRPHSVVNYEDDDDILVSAGPSNQRSDTSLKLYTGPNASKEFERSKREKEHRQQYGGEKRARSQMHEEEPYDFGGKRERVGATNQQHQRLQQLSNELSAEKRRSEQAWRSVDSKNQEIENLRRSLIVLRRQSYGNAYYDAKDRISKLEHDLKDAQSTIDGLCNINAKLIDQTIRKDKMWATEQNKQADRVQLLQDENNRLKESLQVQELAITRAQSRAFESLDEAARAPPEDASVRHLLDNLEKAIRDWAKTHTSSDGLDIIFNRLSDLDKIMLESEWADFTIVVNGSPTIFNKSGLADKAWVLVAAWLAHRIYTDIITDPFSLMDKLIPIEEPIMASDFMNLGTCLTAFDIKFTSYYNHEPEAMQAWRCATMRLLHPVEPAEMEPEQKRGLEAVQTAVDNAVQQRNERFASDFVQRAQEFLRTGNENAGDDSSAIQELIAIAIKAPKIASILWTQKSQLTCESTGWIQMPFKNTSPYMEPHKLHTAALDDDEKCLDGKYITLVCNPALIMAGDSEGLHHDVERVLKKGVVLMMT